MKSNNRLNYPNLGLPNSFGRLIRDAFEGLDDLGEYFTKPAVSHSRQHPKIDLFEDEQSYFVLVELPGVAKSDIAVELLEGKLEIGATISRETKHGRKNIPLKRTVELPDSVSDEGIKAKLEDGVLTVTLPKAEEVKPRSIEIE